METLSKDRRLKTFRPPKPFWTLSLQIFGFLIPTMLAITTLTLDYVLTIDTYLFIGFWFVITFLLLYFPRNEFCVKVSKEENILEITKRDQLYKKYDLRDIAGFFSKYTWGGGGRSFKLSVKKSDDSYEILFALEGLKGAFFSYKQWYEFSDKLAHLCDKEYKREVWVANYNGDLEIKTQEEYRTIKRTVVLYPILIFAPLIGAIFFHRNPTVSAFIGYGVASVLLNGFVYSFLFKKLEGVQHGEKNRVFRVSMLFYSMITSSGLYVLCILLVKLYLET